MTESHSNHETDDTIDFNINIIDLEFEENNITAPIREQKSKMQAVFECASK